MIKLRELVNPKSVFVKILVINSVFMLLLFLILVWNNYYIKGKIRSEGQEANGKYLTYVSDNIDQNLSKIENDIYFIKNGADFISLQYEKEKSDYIKYYTKLQSLSRSLNFIKTSFPYVSECYVYFGNIGEIVTSKSSDPAVSTDVFFDVLHKGYPDFSNKTFSFSNLHSGFYFFNDFVFFVYPVNSQCCVLAQFDKSGLMSYLQNINKTFNNGNNIVSVVGDRGDLFASSKPIDHFDFGMIKDSVEHQKTIAVNKTDYQSVYNHSNLSSLYFVLLYPTGYLESKIYSINIYSIILSCIVMLTELVVIFFNIRIYNPLRNIMDRFKISGRANNTDEFKVINNLIDDMKNENEDLKSLFSQTKDVLYHNSLVKLIQGQDDLFDEAAQQELNKRLGQFVVLSMITDHENADTVACAKKFFDKVLSAHYSFTKVLHQPQIESYIISLSGSESVSTVIDEICRGIADDLGTSAVCGISQAFGSVGFLNVAYRQSLAAIDSSRFDMSSNVILSEYDKDRSKSKPVELSLDDERELTQYVLWGNVQEVNRFLEKRTSQLTNVSRREAAVITSRLSDLLNTIVYSKGESDKSETELALPVNLSGPHSPMYIHEQLKKSFLKVAEFNALQDRSLLKKLVDYIDCNYMKDISLDSIAKELSVTPVYISMYIKKHLGVNFTPYLNKIRVDAAIRIMKETSTMSMKEISERAGFLSVNTFINHFKEYTGALPSVYRKSLNVK